MTILNENGEPMAREEPKALVTRPLNYDALADLLEPVDLGPEAQKTLEEAGVYRQTQLRMALQQSSPKQWTVFAGEDGKETLYPQGYAAAAMLGMFGLHWAWPTAGGPELYAHEMYTEKSGARFWLVKSKLWRGDKFICLAEGKREIGSGYAHSELDARFDAFQNLQSRAVRTVFGLGGKSREDFRAMGLDLIGAGVASFQDHKTSLSSDPAMAVVPFGRDKGKKLSDCEELGWLREQVARNVADPSKATYKAKNEALLKAIEAELAKRSERSEGGNGNGELQKLVAAIREEAAVLQVPEEKIEAHLKNVTLEVARKTLESYRAERKRRESKEAPGL